MSSGEGVSPGNVPVYYGSGCSLEVVDGKVKVVELLLRCLVCGLGVTSALLVGTATQVREIFTIEKRAKFTDMKAMVFLVVANSMVAAYSLAQFLRCAVSISRGAVLFNKALAWSIFVLDQCHMALCDWPIARHQKTKNSSRSAASIYKPGSTDRRGRSREERKRERRGGRRGRISTTFPSSFPPHPFLVRRRIRSDHDDLKASCR